MNKRKLVLICTTLTLTIGIFAYSSSKISEKTSINDLQATNIAAITGGPEEYLAWAELVMSVGGWLRSTFDDGLYHCRCHMSINTCMGGNQISFRRSCYSASQEVDCFPYSEKGCKD